MLYITALALLWAYVFINHIFKRHWNVMIEPELKEAFEKNSNEWLNPNNSQTENQQVSKSPLYGYRKPLADELGEKWCHCTTPTLTRPCMRK